MNVQSSKVAADTPADDKASRTYHVFFDDQCEVCQACVSLLKLLDTKQQTACVSVAEENLATTDSRLNIADCLHQLHVLTPDRQILVGWDAVARLAGLFSSTWLIGKLGQWFPFRPVGSSIYAFVARNRYALSKCRGGVCQVAKPQVVRRQAGLGAFWSCYTLGLLFRIPVVAWAGGKAAIERVRLFVRTYHRRLDLLNGKLTILFLNGLLPNTVPLIFGELFTTILYDGVAVDPGSPKMRRSLALHLRQLRAPIHKIVATHAHEEHVGNLNWLSEIVAAPVYVSEMTGRFLSPFKQLPFVRAAIIGQPPNLKQPYHFLDETLQTDSGHLRVISTPGHCDDHIALYDPREKLLIAGDAFMGSYFSTPNPDVDSQIWIATLERLLELDIEILVEGHGHIHTLRTDIPDFPGVVIREDPKAALAEKLDYLRWLGKQIEAGFQDGLPLRIVEASCFPWGRRSTWESFANDECIRLLSLGHFSHTELVRSFVRHGSDPLPTLYEARLSGGKQSSEK